MTEEEKAKSGTDPADLWMQWYDTSTKMWSDAMRGAQESQADPWGLYRQWLEGIEEARERITGNVGEMPDVAQNMQAFMGAMSPMRAPAGVAPMGAMDPEKMREWSEQLARSWQRSFGLGMDMMNAAPRWMQMMEQAQKSMTEAVDADVVMDPLQFVVQWYNATSGPLSEFVKDILEQEEFLEPSSRFLQNYARLYKVFGQASEQYLSLLQLPTRSDITRVASLIVALEEKVDRIEEAFEDFEYGYADPATTEEVRSLEGRIDQLGRKLESSGSGQATAESVSNLENRMDQVEGKLDRLLGAVESLRSEPSGGNVPETNGSEAREIQATEAARRKAREMGLDLAKVKGTGSNGQITVEDVRKKGAS